MTEITYEQAKQHLCSYGTAVHCEIFRQYKRWQDDTCRFYFDRGCVISADEYDYKERRADSGAEPVLQIGRAHV